MGMGHAEDVMLSKSGWASLGLRGDGETWPCRPFFVGFGLQEKSKMKWLMDHDLDLQKGPNLGSKLGNGP